METQKKIIVTGGSGLIGKSVQMLIEEQAPANETWIFLSSKDGNLV